MICKAFGNWRTALGAKDEGILLANSAFVYKGTQLMPLVLFSVLLPLLCLSVGGPQFTQGNRAWALTFPDRVGQTCAGIVAMPWQIVVSTKVNLSGWLVPTAWDCECSQKDDFKRDNSFVLSLYFRLLAGVSYLLLFPRPIRGVCSAQMGSSKNLLSNLVFSKHMYTGSFWRLITRPNVGAFSQEQQITYLITRQLSLSRCKSTLKQVQ